ncbi:MAG: metallophosphoesterase [Planctomycetia bacterium]|nr:metallophosphoesterase [Planctomycetia bacterium]
MRVHAMIGILTWMIFSTAQVSAADGIQFAVPPYLQITGQNEMTVCFVTDQDALGQVEFSEGESLGEDPSVVYESHHGLRQNRRIFRVPLKNLKPDTSYTYQVRAKQITKQAPYKVEFGPQITDGPYTFRTLASPVPGAGKDDVILRFLVFNDIHDRYGTFDQLWSQVRDEPVDLIIMNGDILADPTSEQAIFSGLKRYAQEFASRIPMVYVRGNHETRGPLATSFREYFAYPDEPFYFDFSDAGVRFVILDFGEDKPDTEPVYAGLCDFDAMRTEEATWLADAVKKPEFTDAVSQIVICHSPTHPWDGWHGMKEIRDRFAPILNGSGVDLYIAGHTHRALIVRADEYPKGDDAVPNRYAIATGDGPDEKRAVVQVFTVYGDGHTHVKQVKTDGSIREEATFAPVDPQ